MKNVENISWAWGMFEFAGARFGVSLGVAPTTDGGLELYARVEELKPHCPRVHVADYTLFSIPGAAPVSWALAALSEALTDTYLTGQLITANHLIEGFRVTAPAVERVWRDIVQAIGDSPAASPDTLIAAI